MEITEEMLYKYAPAAEKLWLGSLPPDDQIPEHQFSQRFERKMKKLIRYQRHSPSMRQFMRIARQTAAVILVVVSLSFSCLMTVEAYRAKFIEVVTEVFYDLTHFTFFSSWSGDIGLGEIEFGYLPDGMVEVQRETFEKTQGQTIYFEDDHGYQIKISQTLLTDDTNSDLILDSEDADATTIAFGDGDAVLIEKEGTSTLMWEDTPYLMLLTGDFLPEEIVKIANGITISK